MASSTPQTTQTIASHDENDSSNYRFALTALTSLFFMWGFLTCLNDILIPYLKAVFSLNFTQAMLIQFCFFTAYGIVSTPAGKLVRKIGYQKGIVCGLSVATIGCLLFIPAAHYVVYPIFLGALFVLAAGITILQVSANPYVTALGNPETASSRLTMTQAFNSLGTTIAPFFGSILILSAATAGAHELQQSQNADSVIVPYLILAAALAILAIIFSRLKLPVISEHNLTEQSEANIPSNSRSAWDYPHLVLGAIGIFVYVGAEVAIGSFLVNFIAEPHIAGLPESQAAHYVAYYWGGAMVGRFIGAAVMQKVRPGYVLAFNASMATLLIAVAAFGSGKIAMYAILLVGLCNSIMFPTIFALAVNKLGPHTSQGSGILCTAIIGGAFIPLLQGVLADAMGIQLAFILPIFCYVYIIFYGLKGSEAKEA